MSTKYPIPVVDGIEARQDNEEVCQGGETEEDTRVEADGEVGNKLVHRYIEQCSTRATWRSEGGTVRAMQALSSELLIVF